CRRGRGGDLQRRTVGDGRRVSTRPHRRAIRRSVLSMSTTGEQPRAADLVVASLERLPFGRTHFKVASLLGVGTFFDAFDSLIIGVVLTTVITAFGVGFGS